MNKYEHWHSEELIKEAIAINAEIHARLKGVMFALSLAEQQGHSNLFIDTILTSLRGKAKKEEN